MVASKIATSRWASIVFAKGKPFNVDHNQNGRSNHYTLFLDNSHPLNGSRKSPFHFGFQRALPGSSSMNNV
jgi:hypothetical protein